MKKLFVFATVLVLAASVAACERKDAKVVKTVKVERVVVPKEALSLQSLDKRVSAVEARNAAVDAKVRTSKGKFSPAPKYDPNYKG